MKPAIPAAAEDWPQFRARLKPGLFGLPPVALAALVRHAVRERDSGGGHPDAQRRAGRTLGEGEVVGQSGGGSGGAEQGAAGKIVRHGGGAPTDIAMRGP